MEMLDDIDFASLQPAADSRRTPSPTRGARNFFFANVEPDVNIDARFFEAPHPATPTTVQRNLCLDATSDMNVELTDDEDASHARDEAKVCLCAVTRERESQADAQRQPPAPLVIDVDAAPVPFKTSSITEDYRITHEIIGIGESGKVMACFSKKDGTKHALKVLRDGPKSRREVLIHYATSHHKNIVSIDDIYENTFDCVKCILVVLEYLEAGDLLGLFEAQQSRPYSEECVANILSQIGSAVQYLHASGIAHRDIKLENILCSTSDHATCTYKLGDFGFAKRPERNHLMESPCCTPIYVAPEILSHERYDKSCDTWSLGVVMYILLSGYPPFYSLKGLPLSPGMRTRITSGVYAFPPEEFDKVSDDAKNEIRHLLRTEPAARTTIDELLRTPFVTRVPATRSQARTVPGASSEAAAIDSGFESHADSSDEPMTPDVVAPTAPLEVSVPRVVRRPPAPVATHAHSTRAFAPPRSKTARLHSITEELSHAIDMLRMHEAAAPPAPSSRPLRPLRTASGGSGLYERRARRNLSERLRTLERADSASSSD